LINSDHEEGAPYKGYSSRKVKNDIPQHWIMHRHSQLRKKNEQNSMMFLFT
jgi:hypothetical protein